MCLFRFGSLLLLYLHSNMFLLIRYSWSHLHLRIPLFTFQYVSINTPNTFSFFQPVPYLHSNMFLLIRKSGTRVCPGYIHLHSNMFLLIPMRNYLQSVINLYLHSNMFLLIPQIAIAFFNVIFIYIPICFY